MLKLYAKIRDNEGSYERVVLCPFKNDNDETVYIEEVEEENRGTFFKVLLDEGYCRTYYSYPVPRFSIVEMEKYE